jgi:hypothetical protein
LYMTSQFIKFNKIVITKVALILNVRKLIVYIEYTCRHAVASSSKQVLPVLYTFKPSIYRVHSLEKYSIFSTSTAIDQKTRSVHIYGHLNTYIYLKIFDYRTLLVYTLQLTFKVGVYSVFECYWLMEYNGKANC